MLNRNEQQLIDLLNEKNSRLLHELAEQRRETRRLKRLSGNRKNRLPKTADERRPECGKTRNHIR